MSDWFGDILEGGTAEVPFNFYDSSGNSISFGGDDIIKVYKDYSVGSEVTEGVSLLKDHGEVTGTHMVVVEATHAFYTKGSNYHVKIIDASVDSKTVSSFIGSFSIENTVEAWNKRLLEGDELLDYSVEPAKRIIYDKGTTTEILKKGLYKIDQTSDVTTVTDTIGMSVDITI